MESENEITFREKAPDTSIRGEYVIKEPHTNAADVYAEKIKAAILAVNCACITESTSSSHT